MSQNIKHIVDHTTEFDRICLGLLKYVSLSHLADEELVQTLYQD